MHYRLLSTHATLLIFITNFFSSVFTADIQVSSSASSLNAGQLSNYTFTLNRNLSVTGVTITPETLTTNYIVQIIFSENYDIEIAAASLGSYSGQETFNNNNTIQLYYSGNGNGENINQLSFTLSDIRNPFLSGISQIISFSIKNSTQSTVNQGEVTLSYNSFAFSQSNSWNPTFSPGTVSTNSNMTLSFIPDVWKSSTTDSMRLVFGFNRYWTRSLSNLTSTSIFSTSSQCSPSCTITLRGSFYEVSFNNLNITFNSTSNYYQSLSLKFVNILSPPTLQPIDLISISSIETTQSTTIQTDSLLLSSTLPNNIQTISVSTPNSVSEVVSLSINFTTQNIFGPNDTVILELNQPLESTSTPNITLNNAIVSGYNLQISSLTEIRFNSFSLLTSTYGRISFNLQITNSISPLRSSKPVTNNKISILRNGYLYNEAEFSFNVKSLQSTTPIELEISTPFANFNSTLTIGPIQLTQPLVPTDYITISIPEDISVYSQEQNPSTCIPISCIGCLCTVTTANTSTTQSTITVTNFPQTNPKTTFTLSLEIKNPIEHNQIISVCQSETSSLIECWNGTFPTIVQSTLDSQVIDFSNSNDFIYQISNYSIGVNLTNYDLALGYFLLYFERGLFLVDSSTSNPIICNINNQPICDFSASTNVSEQIIIKVAVSNTSQKIYQIELQSVRNPKSTQPFQFVIEVYSNNTSPYSVYYTINSQFYRINNPYQITSIINVSGHTPCTNSQPSIITLQMSSDNLPFDPTPALVIDNPTASTTTNNRLGTLNQQIVFQTGNITIPINNFKSLQPITYSLLVKTSNLLYNVYSFEFTLQNCEPSTLHIDSWSVSGLLGEEGQLIVVFNPSMEEFTYLQITFPNQYSSNMTVSESTSVTTEKVSPRTFRFILSNILPRTLKISGFIHQSQTTDFIRLETYLNSSNSSGDSSTQQTYLVSSDSNTIRYNLSTLTSCTFPCKICSPTNSSICLQCYSQQFTENYLLVGTTCQSSCPTVGFYLNEVSSICETCPLQCQQCTSNSNCTLCADNYYRLNGSCLTDCPQTYYPITTDQECASCSFPCLECIDSTNCKTCQSLYYLSTNRTCELNCLTSELPMLGVCRSCETPCLSCSGALNNCTSCPDGYFLYENQCLGACPSPFVPAESSNNNNICTTCSLPCLSCAINPSQCTSCTSPLKLSSGQCITSCPTSQYQSNNICIQCPIECLLCSSSTNCSVCSQGFTLYQSTSCIAICPSGYFLQTISNSTNPILNNTQQCTPCSQSNCIQCHNQSSCQLCVSGYFLHQNQTCVSQCPISTFESVYQCENCSNGCLYCINAAICEACSVGFALQNGTCVSECASDEAAISNNITVSSVQSSSVLTVIGNICTKCSSLHENCLECINAVNCEKCRPNYVLASVTTTTNNSTSTTNQCSLTCPLGYIDFNSLGFCLPCESQCQTCNNLLSNCTSCPELYTLSITNTTDLDTGVTLVLQTCLTTCPQGTVAYLDQCTPCNAPCSTCQSTPQTCTSCLQSSTNTTTTTTNTASYYLLNSSCLTQCPSSYYPFNSSSQPICIQCPTECSTCNSLGCLSCATGYFTDLNPQIINSISYPNCYTSCPSHLTFILSQSQSNVCSKCSDNCMTCSSQTYECLECQSEYFIYDVLYCTTECPLPLEGYQGRCVDTTQIPQEEDTEQTPIFYMPVPFTIASVIILIVCGLSKLQNHSTILSISAYSLVSFVCVVCNLFYFITFLTTISYSHLDSQSNDSSPSTTTESTSPKTSQTTSTVDNNNSQQLGIDDISDVLLLISLILNFLLNLLFLVLIKWTLLRDDSFNRFWISHRPSTIIVWVIGALTTHTNYIILFSRLFGLGIFKAYLENLYNISILNYLWIVQILTYLLAMICGILKLTLNLLDTSKQFTLNQSTLLLYQSLDLLLLNLLLLGLSLICMKKSKENYLRHQDAMSTVSESTTKKVIFDQSSDYLYDGEHNNGGNRYGADGMIDEFYQSMRGKNFKIANFDETALFPEQTTHKFLNGNGNGTENTPENDQNHTHPSEDYDYDKVFRENNPTDSQQQNVFDQFENVEFRETGDRLNSGNIIMSEEKSPQQKMSVFRSTVQVQLTNEEMSQHLEEMQQKKDNSQSNRGDHDDEDENVNDGASLELTSIDQKEKQHSGKIQHHNDGKFEDMSQNVDACEVAIQKSEDYTFKDSITHFEKKQQAVEFTDEKHQNLIDEEDPIQSQKQSQKQGINHHQKIPTKSKSENIIQSFNEDFKQQELNSHPLQQQNAPNRPTSISLLIQSSRTPPKYPKSSNIAREILQSYTRRSLSGSRSTKSIPSPSKKQSFNSSNKSIDSLNKSFENKRTQENKTQRQKKSQQKPSNGQGKANRNQQQKQSLIPPYLFTSNYHRKKQQKPPSNPRISGIGNLFEREQPHTVQTVAQIKEKQKRKNSNRINVTDWVFNDLQLDVSQESQSQKSKKSPKSNPNKEIMILQPEVTHNELLDEFVENDHQERVKVKMQDRKQIKHAEINNKLQEKEEKNGQRQKEEELFEEDKQSMPQGLMKDSQPIIKQSRPQKNTTARSLSSVSRKVNHRANTIDTELIDFSKGNKIKHPPGNEISSLLKEIQRKEHLQAKTKALNAIYQGKSS